MSMTVFFGGAPFICPPCSRWRVQPFFHLHGRRDARTMWSLPHSTRSTIIVETAVVALRWVEKTQKGIFGMKIIVFLVSIVYLHVFSSYHSHARLYRMISIEHLVIVLDTMTLLRSSCFFSFFSILNKHQQHTKRDTIKRIRNIFLKERESFFIDLLLASLILFEYCFA